MAIGTFAYQRGPVVASQPIRLAPRPVFLAGREELLAELHARLTRKQGQFGPQMVVLCGLGGAGKTSVAVEYAHRHLAELAVCWQFPAEDPAVLAAEFTILAAQLGARDLVDPRDPVASVHAVLARQETEWLLVFDNASDRESVARYLPPGGLGQVLITSQNPNWPSGQACGVPVLDTEVAANFLINRTGDPELQVARDLAEELGGLPLALEQAAAYTETRGISLGRYLQIFRQRRPAMLARGEPTGYSKTVATTWSLGLIQLERFSPMAVGLLRLLAYYASEAIPLSLLLKTHPSLDQETSSEVITKLEPLFDDQLAAVDAVAALRRYSLVTPAGTDSISVHRLVQAVTIGQMPPGAANYWRQAAAALIEAAIPADTDAPEGWSECAALLPHAQASLENHSSGIVRLANYLGQRGSYAAALELQRRVLNAQQQVLGPDHVDTLTARHELARWTGYAGNAAGARDQYDALLPVRERILGPDHADTLSTRHQRAYWTGEAGDAATARDQLAALLPVEERSLGPDHLVTLATRHECARWTGMAGDANRARDQFAALLPVEQRVFGHDHPRTLTVRHNLASFTGYAGDVIAARDQYAALLPTRSRVLGPQHPSTLATRHRLAHWTGEAGDAAAARDQLAALLPIRERVLGFDHPDTLATRHDLAHWTEKSEIRNPTNTD